MNGASADRLRTALCCWRSNPVQGSDAPMSKSTLPSARLSRADVQRLHAQIIRTSSCHIWMGAVGTDGYGKFWVHTPPAAAQASDPAVRNRAARVITPHAAVSALVFGPLPLGSTHLHDCDVRLCVNTNPGHLRRGTQRENVRQAVARGHSRGRKPGMVDVRGPAGASIAIQDAIHTAILGGLTSPARLAQVLAEVIAEGFPMVDVVPLFEEPPHVPLTAIDDFPADLFTVPLLTPAWGATATTQTVPLFDL